MHLTSTAVCDLPALQHASFQGLPTEPSVSIAKLRDERTIETCECLIDVVAALFSVSSKELRQPGRSSACINRVRQVAMYVAHVVLRLTMIEVGQGFGRDRTTVLHACRIVEDMRDDKDFDEVVSVVERVAGAAFRSRSGD